MRNYLRNGDLDVNTPGTDEEGAAVTLGGTAWPWGSPVQYVWSTSETAPVAGWAAATVTAGTGNWAVTTTMPALDGTYYLHARLTLRPNVTRRSSPVVVTEAP